MSKVARWSIAFLLSLSVCQVVTADDPPAGPAPLILQSAETAYSSEIAKVEEQLARARKVAADARLKAYKDRLVELTKAGNFDQAVAAKARIEQLEKEPDASAPKSPKRPKPRDAVRFDGHSYALIKDPATWHVAKRRCEEMGGHLVVLDSPKESQFVATLCGNSNCWIGATDEEKEGHWVWVVGNGSFMPAGVHLNGDRGISHCLCLYEGEWHDGASGERFFYVAEWDH